jgi:5-methylcytosine-specific restriction protein B
VSGFYYYVPDVYMGHCRPVIWEDLVRRQVADLPKGWRFFSQLSRQVYEKVVHAPPILDRRAPQLQKPSTDVDASAAEGAEDVPHSVRIHEPKPLYGTTASEPHHPMVPAISLSQCAAETGFPEARLAEWYAAIERKGQAVFYGPPGTGKSFVAAHLARHLVGGDDGFIETVQFHPAYAYEDFVQGIRPVVEVDGGLTYRLVPGLFSVFCQEAARRRGRCVLVIDEINRADLARVFGEVMQLLEYREQTLALATGGYLRIPANVRIIGTMNTADRSIALVDAALRRRFAFLALYPDYDVLCHYHTVRETEFPVERLVDVLRRINKQIGDADYALGITPFLRSDLLTTIGAIWQTEIEPYLEEYFFNRPADVDALRWHHLRNDILGERA